MDYYKLIRDWFDFTFENPDEIKPNHIALYTFCVEHCNRLGWKKKFGLPTTMAKEAIGIRSYNTYIKTLNDLVKFGFIIMVEKSKNQYSSNIIALSYFNKASTKALDKAFIKHDTKQSESTIQSIDSIIIQLTSNQYTNKQLTKLKGCLNNLLDNESKEESTIPSYSIFQQYALLKDPLVDAKALKNKYDSWVENGWKDGYNKPIKNWKSKLINNLTYLPKTNTGNRAANGVVY